MVHLHTVGGYSTLAQTPQICYTVNILNVMLSITEFVLFKIKCKIEEFLTFKEKNLDLKYIRKGVCCVREGFLQWKSHCILFWVFLNQVSTQQQSQY